MSSLEKGPEPSGQEPAPTKKASKVEMSADWAEQQTALADKKPVSFLRLWRFATKGEVAMNIVGLLCAAVGGALEPGMTLIFGRLTNSLTSYQAALTRDDPAALLAATRELRQSINDDVLRLVYIGLGEFAAVYIYMAVFSLTGERITRRVRERYFEAVLRQNLAFFDKLSAGEITTRITSTHLLQVGISEKVPIAFSFVAQFVAGFVIAIVVSWRVGLVIASAIPAIMVSGLALDIFASKYRKRMLDTVSAAGTIAEEAISSIRTVHAFGTQEKLIDRFDVPNAETERLGKVSAGYSGVGIGVLFFIVYGCYGLAFYWGTTLILRGQANPGQVITAFFSVLIGAFALSGMAPHLQAFSSASGSAAHLYAVIDRVPPIDPYSEEGQKPSPVQGNIVLQDVDFIYPARPTVQVLKSFSATFPRGKTTALVGASGSGKSTICSLLERFYDPLAGTICLDGVDLKDLNVSYLRSQIGLVSQEPVLFSTSIFENIAHGFIGTKYEFSSEEDKRRLVYQAAKVANAHDFITALTDGYDTVIGERGMLLSGGQRQRVALARAIVGDRPILLLDEATASLDSRSERIVQEALDRAAVGRTTIAIAHRLSTIKNADQIIVMSEGAQVESMCSDAEGTAHEHLLRRHPDGAYASLVRAQAMKELDPKSVAADIKLSATPARSSLDKHDEKDNDFVANLPFMSGKDDLETNALTETTSSKVKKESFPNLVLRIIQLNKANAWMYVVGGLASAAVGAAYPTFSIIFGGVVQVFSESGQELRDGGNRYALYAFALGIAMLFLSSLQFGLFGWSAERLSRTLRRSMFRATLRQDISYFDERENSTGTLTGSISDTAQKIQGLLGPTMSAIIQSICTLIIGTIVGLAYSWRIGLVGLACVPFTLTSGLVRLKVVTLKDDAIKSAHEESSQQACESASAIRTVASLTRERDCSKKFSECLEAPARKSERSAIVANGTYALSQALPLFIIGLIFWYGSNQMIAGNVSVGHFFVAFTAIVLGSIETGHVFNYVPDASSARLASAKLLKLLDARPTIDAQEAKGATVSRDGVDGSIKFQDVNFWYPSRPQVQVLRNLCLEVRPGQYAAVVGHSGSGKSTLVGLIERFYDPTSGSVLLDGQDVRSLNVVDYRNQLAIVSQEPVLYDGTIRSNIEMGLTVGASASQELVEEAAKKANIHDFIMSLPDQYDTLVGSKGTQLSGGQRQRCCLARALIRNPKVLILDEATSALDSQSERVVQQALDQAAEGRTTIAIAHRLSTVQHADVIFVISNGAVVEKGTHQELMDAGGIYHELVTQQTLQV